MPRSRRMLGRSISHSNRVNKLSDQGALLYTWMIPQYDDEGRMDGDPEDLKFNVVPRRDISVEQVIEILFEMEDLGLITWYMADDKPYIEMPPDVWRENQSFKGIKKQKSKIPGYKEGYQKVREHSTLKGLPLHPLGLPSPPEEVDHSTVATPQDKIRKDKRFTNVNQPPADRSSKHFSSVVGDEYKDRIVKLGKQVIEKSNGKRNFAKVFSWIQKMTNEGMHPQAIVETLQEVVNRWESIGAGKAWGYANNTCASKSFKFDEKDRIAESQKFKNTWQAYLDTDQGKKLAGILDQSLKRMDLGP